MAKKEPYNPYSDYEEAKKKTKTKGEKFQDFKTFERDLKRDLRSKGYNLGESIDYLNESLKLGDLPVSSGQDYIDKSKNRIDASGISNKMTNPNLIKRGAAGTASIIGNFISTPFVLWDNTEQAVSDWMDTNNPNINKNYGKFVDSRMNEYEVHGKIDDINHQQNYLPEAQAFTGEQRYVKHVKKQEPITSEEIIPISQKNGVETYNPNNLDYTNYSFDRYNKDEEKSEEEIENEELRKTLKNHELETKNQSIENVVDYEGKWSGYLMENAKKDKERALYGLEGFERFIGEAIFSAADMLPTAAITATLGPLAGAAVMGGRSASNQMYEASADGVTSGDAFKSGLSTGIIEAGTEKLALNKLADVFKGSGKSILKNIGSQAVAEGLEEGASYIGQTLANQSILGDKAADLNTNDLLSSIIIGGMVGGLYGGFGSMGKKGQSDNVIQDANKLSKSSSRMLNTVQNVSSVNQETIAQENNGEQTETKQQKIIDLEKYRMELATQYKNANHKYKGAIASDLASVDSKIKNVLDEGRTLPSVEEVKNTLKDEYKGVYNKLNELTNEKLTTEDPNRLKTVNKEIEGLIEKKKELSSVMKMPDSQLSSELDKRLNKINDYEKELILKSADNLGIKVDFKDVNTMPNDAEGFYQNGAITLANETYNEPLQVFVHELTHFAETSDFYDQYANAAKDIMVKKGQDYDYIKHQVVSDYTNKGIALSESDADKEVIAQFTQELIKSETDLKSLVKSDRNLAQKVLDWVKLQLSKFSGDKDLINARNILSKSLNTATLTDDIKKYSINSKSRKISLDKAKDIKKVSSIAINDCGELKPISEQILNYLEGNAKRYDLIVAKEDSIEFSEYGINDSKMITINQSVIDKILSDPESGGHNDSVNVELIEKIINNPDDIVFAIKNNYDNYAFVYDIKGLNDSYILMSMYPEKGTGREIVVNSISSMYGKDISSSSNPLQDLIDKAEKNGFEIIKNKKSDNFAVVAGVRYPRSSQKVTTSNINIHNYDDTVKQNQNYDDITNRDEGIKSEKDDLPNEPKYSGGKNYFSKDAEGKERYVLKVPNSMFIDGDGKAIPMEARKKILRRFLLDNYRGKLINVGDLYDAKFTSETASELSYKKALNQPIKNEVVTDIEPILKNAEYIETVEDYGHHPEAIDGWDYFKINFGIDDGHNLDKYKAKLSIMNTEKGPIIYEINEIKKDSTSEQSSNEPVASGAITKYSLGQNQKNVNTKATLNEKIINYDYSKRKMIEEVIVDGKSSSFSDGLDILSTQIINEENTDETKRILIDEAIDAAKLRDRVINSRPKEIRKYLNGYKTKTFYVNTNVAKEMGYDSFTELNKELGPINLSMAKGNKITGHAYSKFSDLYSELSEQYSLDKSLDDARATELIKEIIHLNDDKVSLSSLLGQDNFKRHLELSLNDFEERIKNSKLGYKERLERKQGKMDLDPTYVQNHEFAKELPTEVNEDIQLIANYGINKSSKLKTLDQNISDIAGDNENILQAMKRVVMDPLQKSKTLNNKRKIQSLKKVNEIITDYGIKAGSPESAAVMWIGEGKRRIPIGKRFGKTKYATNLQGYDLNTLKKDFPSSWQNIVDAEKTVRTIYNQYIEDINDMLKGVYSEQSLKDEVSKQQLHIKEELDFYQSKLESEIEPFEQNKLRKKIAKLSQRYNSVTNEVYRNKRLVPRKDYFIHFNEIMLSDDLKDIVGMSDLTEVQERKGISNIPNELASISEFTKPKAKWSSFLQSRSNESNNYVEDAVGGLLRYINLAEYKIAYDPYIDYMRSVNKSLISASNDAQVKNEHIIKYLSDFTDSLAGKRLDTDRSILGQIKEKKTYKLIKLINRKMKANAVLMNFNSAVSQFYNLPNAQIVLAKNSGKGYLKDVAKGTKFYGEDIANGFGDIDQSTFMTERYIDGLIDDLSNTSKMNKAASNLLSFGDKVVAKQVWYSAFAQGQRLNVENPINYADTLTRQAIAGRGVGEVPLWFNSELGKFITPFQVEVANSFFTAVDSAKRSVKINKKGVSIDKNALKGLMSAALVSFLMNLVNEELTGRNVGIDPIGVAIDSLEKGDNIIGRFAGNIIENAPGGSYIASMMGGSDFAKENFFGDNDPSRYGTGLVGLSQLSQLGIDLFSGNDVNWQGLASLALPIGGKQVERTYKAAEDMGFIPKVDFNLKEGFKVKSEPGAYTGSDKLKYIVDTSDPLNVFKGLVFGSTATNEGKKYAEDGRTISEKRFEHALAGDFLNSDFSNAARNLKSENLKDSAGEGVRNSRAAMNREILIDNDVWNDLKTYYKKADDDTKKSIVSSYNLTNEIIGMSDNEFTRFVKTLESYK